MGEVWLSPQAPQRLCAKSMTALSKGCSEPLYWGVKSDRDPANIQADLDELLIKRKSSEATPLNPADVGPVAEIPNTPFDPEVTRAPDLQARVAAIDWKQRAEFTRIDLLKKSTAYTVLMKMCDRCGIQEKDNQALINLTKKVAGKDSPSVWKLFTERYTNLTLFQKFSAGLFYWVYYKTSILSNSIEAIMNACFKMTEDLTSENSSTRTVFFSEVLKNANQFLIEDIRATKDFAYEKVHGDLEECRNRAIEEHIGFSLKAICKAVSEKMVSRDFRVPFSSPLCKKFHFLEFCLSGLNGLLIGLSFKVP